MFSFIKLVITHNIMAVVIRIRPTIVDPIAMRAILVTIILLEVYMLKVQAQKNSERSSDSMPGTP